MIDVDALSKKYPAIKQRQAYEPIFWKNLNYKKEAEYRLELNISSMLKLVFNGLHLILR